MRNVFQTHCVKDIKPSSWLLLFLFSAFNPRCHHERHVEMGLSFFLCLVLFSSASKNFKTSPSMFATVKTNRFVVGF